MKGVMIDLWNQLFRFTAKNILPGGGWTLLIFFALCSIGLKGVQAGEKIVVGEIEDVILLPWGVKLPARIDTGAALSSLDARDLKVEGGFAEFRLSKKYGGMQLHLPIVDWLTIRSSEASEERPIVEVELCIGSKRVRTRVNLNDRSTVKYPLLIGRNTLKEQFVVDCTQERCSPPACPEVSSK
jgi:hypothetical protein